MSKVFLIKGIFENRYRSADFGKDSIGEYFRFLYPQFKLNHYYFKQDIIVGKWKNFPKGNGNFPKGNGYFTELKYDTRPYPIIILYKNNKLYYVKGIMRENSLGILEYIDQSGWSTRVSDFDSLIDDAEVLETI